MGTDDKGPADPDAVSLGVDPRPSFDVDKPPRVLVDENDNNNNDDGEPPRVVGPTCAERWGACCGACCAALKERRPKSRRFWFILFVATYIAAIVTWAKLLPQDCCAIVKRKEGTQNRASYADSNMLGCLDQDGDAGSGGNSDTQYIGPNGDVVPESERAVKMEDFCDPYNTLCDEYHLVGDTFHLGGPNRCTDKDSEEEILLLGLLAIPVMTFIVWTFLFVCCVSCCNVFGNTVCSKIRSMLPNSS